MGENRLYEKYHSKLRFQKRIISKNNFTYRTIISILARFFLEKKHVLDLGCGSGTIDFYLASKGVNVVGVDISENALKIASSNAVFLGVSDKTIFLNIDYPKMSPKGKYDLVICSEVLEHLKDDGLAVKKIYSLLKKDGKAVISVPLNTAPLYKIGLLVDFDREVGHLRRYSSERLVEMLSRNGFKVIYKEYCEGALRNFLYTNKYAGRLIRFIRGPLSDLVTFIDNLFLKIFGASNVYVVVKK